MGDRVAYFAHLEAIEDQVDRVEELMRPRTPGLPGRWWTKEALAAAARGTPHAMSARLSDLRKRGWITEKTQAEPGSRLYLYRIIGRREGASSA